MRRALALALALAAGMAAPPAAAECRLALALALDVSGSVDAAEFDQQRQGLAAALLAPPVVAAFLAQPEAPVRLHAYEWSGPAVQLPLLPWTEIRSEDDLRMAAGRIAAAGRVRQAPQTAIGAALLHGAAEAARQDCRRRVIDLSGDGQSNAGPPPESLGPALAGVTVNALAVASPGRDLTGAPVDRTAELVAYFRVRVIRGPGAFVEVARGYPDYRRAMERKLLRELSDLPMGALPLPDGSRLAGR